MSRPSERARRAAQTEADPRWAAVCRRDAAADEQFYYSVRSTGVYCRPSCGSRSPRPENVDFHASAAAAEAAGFRPCRRCRPDAAPLRQRQAERVAMACRLIEQAETMPDLGALAAEAGLSPAHFHRLFKRLTGLTPRAYGQARRAEKLRAGLRGAASVTEAVFDAGYNSLGRFYAEAEAVLGMPARTYRDGGPATAIRFAIAQTSLGALLVAQSGLGLCAIALGDDPDALARALQDRFPLASLCGDDPVFDACVAQVVGLVEQPGRACELPLDVRGTAFQQRVWQALREIPPGSTASYAEIAARIGAPRAVRAVAGACAANHLAVLIPCHRVLRSDGSLSGYRWGVERKRSLLAREAGRDAD